MQMMDELTPMRLYSRNRKLYIPFDPTNKKKGARITLLTKDLETSSKLMNLDYVMNPNLFKSYFMNRNVNSYINSSGFIEDKEEEEDEDAKVVREAVEHRLGTRKVYIDTRGTANDIKLLNEYFNDKSVKKYYKKFGRPDYDWPSVTVYGFDSVSSMAKAISGQAVIQHGDIIVNSYSTRNEIFVLNNSSFYEIKEQELDYGMYCKNALITHVAMNCYGCSRELANAIGSAISGQARAIKDKRLQDELENVKGTMSLKDENLALALAICNLYDAEGYPGVARLMRRKDPSVLIKHNKEVMIKAIGGLVDKIKEKHNFSEASSIVCEINFIDDKGNKVPKKCTECGGDIKVFFRGEPVFVCSKCNKYYGTVPFKEQSTLLELANIPDNKIVVGTDFHFVGYDDKMTKIIVKPKSYTDKIIEKQNELVGNDGVFIYLGDIFHKAFHSEFEIPSEMKNSAIELAKRLKGKYKILIRGNHDKLPDEFYIDKCGFTHVCASLTYGNILFTHQPEIVNDPLVNVHGHLHGKGLYPESKPHNYIDVYTVNKDHVDILPNVLSAREEYEKTIKQAPDVDKVDPHQFIDGEKLSLEEIIDGPKNESTILESDGKHSDALKVYYAMDRKEQYYLAGESNYTKTKDSDYIYRNVIRDGVFTVKGFIEVANDVYCKQATGESGSVIIGVHPRYRGEGIAKQLISTMLKELPKERPEISNLIWRANSENKASMKLAEKMGFTMVRKTDVQVMYRYEFKPNKDYTYLDPDVLNERDLTKWMKKNFTITGPIVKPDDKVRTVQDLMKNKRGTSLDAAVLCAAYLQRMGIFNYIGCLLEGTKKELYNAHFFNGFSYDLNNFYVIDSSLKQTRGELIFHHTDIDDIARKYGALAFGGILEDDFPGYIAEHGPAYTNFISYASINIEPGTKVEPALADKSQAFTEAISHIANTSTLENKPKYKIHNINLPNRAFVEGHRKAIDYECTESYLLDESGKQIYFFDDNVLTEANKSYDVYLKKYLFKERLKNTRALLGEYAKVKEMNPWIKKTFPQLKMYNRLNLFVDLSYYNGIFLKNNKRIKDYAVSMYWDFLNRLLEGTPEMQRLYPKNTIYIPLFHGSWDVAPRTMLFDYKSNINPISVIYRMVKRNPDALKAWGNKNIIFLSHNGYFKVDFNTFSSKDLPRFKIFINKLWNGEDIGDDEEEDGYSNNVEEKDTDTSAVIAAKIVDKLERNAGIAIDNLSSIKNADSIATASMNDIPTLRIRDNKIRFRRDVDGSNISIAVGVMSPNFDKFLDDIDGSKLNKVIDSKAIYGIYVP